MTAMEHLLLEALKNALHFIDNQSATQGKSLDKPGWDAAVAEFRENTSHISVGRGILPEAEINLKEVRNLISAAEKTFVAEGKPSTEMTREERIHNFMKITGDMDHVHVHNILKFVNGTLKVSKNRQRKDYVVNLPLTINADVLMPEPNLAYLNTIKSNMFAFIAFVDLVDSKPD